MIAKSLSIVVPNNKCVNNCKFCVAKMNAAINLENYPNLMNENTEDYKNRMQYARDNGCTSLMFTGDTEPQQNMRFIRQIMAINNTLTNPFVRAEIKTTGVLLNDAKLRKLKAWGIDTISMSMSALKEYANFEYNSTPIALRFNIIEFVKQVKEIGFNLRLCLNLTDFYNDWKPKTIFHYCKYVLLADQITFQKLYESDENTIQDQWIKEHKITRTKFAAIISYMKRYCKNLDEGKYIVMGMSIMFNNHCQRDKPILQPNCHLYSLWADKGSLIY